MKTKDQRYFEELCKVDQDHSARLDALKDKQRLRNLESETSRKLFLENAKVIWSRMAKNEVVQARLAQLDQDLARVDRRIAQLV